MVNFKIFGLEIGVSVGFVGVLTFMLYVDRTGLMLLTILGALIHEAGHIALLLIFGCKIQRISFRFGTLAVEGNYSLTPLREGIMLISGPTFNFISFAVFYIAFINFGKIIWLNLSLVMFITGFVNILPIKGLDGGDVLELFLYKRFSIHTAGVILKAVGLITCSAVILGGILLFLATKSNPTLIIFGIYLAVCHFKA